MEEYQLLRIRLNKQMISNTFEIASVLLKLNEFEMAKELFNEILQSNFNSREIYNNLPT